MPTVGKGATMRYHNGIEAHRRCDRCRKVTKQVRDNDYGGWYCTRCMQFHADHLPAWWVEVFLPMAAVVLIGLGLLVLVWKW